MHTEEKKTTNFASSEIEISYLKLINPNPFENYTLNPIINKSTKYATYSYNLQSSFNFHYRLLRRIQFVRCSVRNEIYNARAINAFGQMLFCLHRTKIGTVQSRT